MPAVQAVNVFGYDLKLPRVPGCSRRGVSVLRSAARGALLASVYQGACSELVQPFGFSPEHCPDFSATLPWLEGTLLKPKDLLAIAAFYGILLADSVEARLDAAEESAAADSIPFEVLGAAIKEIRSKIDDILERLEKGDLSSSEKRSAFMDFHRLSAFCDSLAAQGARPCGEKDDLVALHLKNARDHVEHFKRLKCAVNLSQELEDA